MFSILAAESKDMIDYRSINASKVKYVTIGDNARDKLIFEIESVPLNHNETFSSKDILYNVRVECE